MVMRLLDTVGSDCLNNRYHDPLTSQFISVDPLVASTGEPYIYAGGNPATYSDPDGLCPISGPGSAEACWAFAAVDYTTTVHLTDETLTVISSGRPTVHHERGELSFGSRRESPVLLEPPFELDALDLDYLKGLLSSTGGLLNAGGVCGGFELTLGVGVGYEGCVVQAGGEDGLLAIGAVGEPGAEGMIKGGGFTSNASGIDDLVGWSVCFGGDAAAGVGGGVSGCAGIDDYGKPTGVVTLGGAFSLGAGGSAGPSLMYTRRIANLAYVPRPTTIIMGGW